MKKSKRLKRAIAALVVIVLAAISPMSIMADQLHNPVYHEFIKKNNHEKVGSDWTEWSCISFGRYPQSEVTNADLIAKIDSTLSGNSTGDVAVDGEIYRKISSSDVPHSFIFWDNDDDNEPDVAFRYFKWEPIKWRVLNIDEKNGKLFVCADNIIDCVRYHDQRTYDSFGQATFGTATWETSIIRLWLNGSFESTEANPDSERNSFTGTAFYDTAFTQEEQGAILQTTVTNADNPYWGTYGGKDTEDKVFLLSYDEVTNQNYGFATEYSSSSTSRCIRATSYADAMGALSVNTADGDYADWAAYQDGCATWWLRTPGYDAFESMNGRANMAMAVSPQGGWVYSTTASGLVKSYYNKGYQYKGFDFTYSFGIVPALYLNLSSDLWTKRDSKA